MGVRARILSAMRGLAPRTRVIVFEPIGVPGTVRMIRTPDQPAMTPGRAPLVGLMDRYILGLLDPFITLLEVHKLMYFMQAAGLPLRLDYVKHHGGPYAVNLRHVLHAIEGHWVVGYADGGDAPDKQRQLLPGALEEAQRVLAGDADTMARFDRVTDLVEGFESPLGMELLSTLHWVATREGAKCLADITDATYEWNGRKRRFAPEQIHLAARVLAQEDCIPAPDAP